MRVLPHAFIQAQYNGALPINVTPVEKVKYLWHGPDYGSIAIGKLAVYGNGDGAYVDGTQSICTVMRFSKKWVRSKNAKPS